MNDYGDYSLDIVDQDLAFEGGDIEAFELFIYLECSESGVRGLQECHYMSLA